jgi:uncharacterized protein YndB with AHSA1/START domain
VASKNLEVIAEPGKPTILTRRVFDAPRELLWEMFTKPENLKRWLGPRRLTMTVCEIDLRVGGKYRWLYRAPDGQEFSFHGVYREIVPCERMVATFIFDPFPQDEAVDTLTFEQRGNQTIITTHTVHTSVEGRDMHLKNGMEGGMKEGYERLDELVAK